MHKLSKMQGIIVSQLERPTGEHSRYGSWESLKFRADIQIEEMSRLAAAAFENS